MFFGVKKRTIDDTFLMKQQMRHTRDILRRSVIIEQDEQNLPSTTVHIHLLRTIIMIFHQSPVKSSKNSKCVQGRAVFFQIIFFKGSDLYFSALNLFRMFCKKIKCSSMIE